MTIARTAGTIIVVGLLAFGVYRTRDPRRTRLPFGTTDLSTVQPQLARLSAADRALVVGYVTRSGGDVLPPKFADPEAPFTARTFAEAIALQKRFLAGQAVVDAKADARRRDREAALAPLRAALEVELASREIMPRERAAIGPQLYDSLNLGQSFGAKRAIDEVVVTTYRVRNLASRTIASLKGSVDVRVGDGRALDDTFRSCFIEHKEPLGPGQIADVHCADMNKPVFDADRAYVAAPVRTLSVEWTPVEIVFADGTSLGPVGS